MDMKTILIQAVYPRGGYLPMALEFLPRHALYCEKFDIDYKFFIGEVISMEKGGWDKLLLIRECLDRYDLIVWLDADAVIRDTDVDLRKVPLKRGVGAVWFPVPEPHYNVGVLYCINDSKTRKTLKVWMEQYPGDDHWHEQQVFNTLDDITRLPDRWNSSCDHNFVENAVVVAGHGIMPLEKRIEFLRSVL